jgi:hypothetical protein
MLMMIIHTEREREEKVRCRWCGGRGLVRGDLCIFWRMPGAIPVRVCVYVCVHPFHSHTRSRSLHRVPRAFTLVADTAHVAVVVEGPALAALTADARLLSDFLALGTHVQAVLCCRVSPIQKAEMVAAVRSALYRPPHTHTHRGARIHTQRAMRAHTHSPRAYQTTRQDGQADKHSASPCSYVCVRVCVSRYQLGQVTLAIGDGANDIAMIQAAHVGVGITGRVCHALLL